MASMTAEMGVLSKPSTVSPMKSPSQMLATASRMATAKPGSNDGISCTLTPRRFFSRALILRGVLAVVLVIRADLLAAFAVRQTQSYLIKCPN